MENAKVTLGESFFGNISGTQNTPTNVIPFNKSECENKFLAYLGSAYPGLKIDATVIESDYLSVLAVLNIMDQTWLKVKNAGYVSTGNVQQGFGKTFPQGRAA